MRVADRVEKPGGGQRRGRARKPREPQTVGNRYGCRPPPKKKKRTLTHSPQPFHQEWLTPQPSRRPDTQPEFERLDPVPPPRKLPGDPELPDEDEEFEKQEKPAKPAPEEDPDAPAPDGEPGEAPEEDDPSQQPIPEGGA